MVNSVYRELVSRFPESRIDFRLQSLPWVSSDYGLVRQIWVNLIDNAIKFSSKKPSCVIDVGHFKEGTENVFFVRDNGAGFDMAYSKKLFGVFQRLHSEREFEGMGVGLALVQRIILRLNGRVWAEGKVNEGATFYFSLPDLLLSPSSPSSPS
ncbi:MAG: ATP-binding protein [Bacteroidetes bacterium]|nr:ATP-binding protein [Bacteroidota bacterium]